MILCSGKSIPIRLRLLELFYTVSRVIVIIHIINFRISNSFQDAVKSVDE